MGLSAVKQTREHGAYGVLPRLNGRWAKEHLQIKIDFVLVLYLLRGRMARDPQGLNLGVYNRCSKPATMYAAFGGTLICRAAIRDGEPRLERSTKNWRLG